MNTVLIVEDEKAIRQGIAAMVRRAPVEVGSVIECRNGIEALRQLDSTEVDLVITDLRMPQMDGLELVEHIGKLENPPLVVVVSGYDDFDYAVRMLRMGVRDYMLKPLDRRDLYTVLERLSLVLEERRAGEEMARLAAVSLLEGLLAEEEADPVAKAGAARLFAPVLDVPWVAVCLPVASCPEALPSPLLKLAFGTGQVLLVVPETEVAGFQSLAKTVPIGYSGVHRGIDALPAAAQQALDARRQAFLARRSSRYEEDGGPTADRSVPVNRELQKVVQLIGKGDAKEVGNILREILLLAQNGQLTFEDYEASIKALCGDITEAYIIFPEIREALKAYENPLDFPSAYAWHTGFTRWVQDFCSGHTEREESQTQWKVQAGILYLKGNFHTEINMAVVSNQVSMNYSQFSALFKRYTGLGFQAYLRSLRLEESKRLLRETGLTVQEISEKSGFRNPKHFMKVFKEETAVTPTEYRRNEKRRLEKLTRIKPD